MALGLCSVLKCTTDAFFIQVDEIERTYYSSLLSDVFHFISDDYLTYKIPEAHTIAPYVLLTFNNGTETEE